MTWIRAQTFSLGVVLYEVLTGRLPFKGTQEAAIIYEIVNVDPPLASSVRKEVNPELDGIIAECMVKDPEERFQSAKEVSRQLKRVQKDSEHQRRGGKDTREDADRAYRVPAKKDAPRRRLTGLNARLLWIATGIVVAVVATVYLIRLFERLPEINPHMTTRILKTPLPHAGYPGMTLDGAWIAFPGMDDKGRWDYYVMNTSGGDARRVTNERIPLLNSGADISPDGSQIAFDASGLMIPNSVQVRVVPTLGGTSKAIVDNGILPQWRPDGKRIGYLQIPSRSKSGKMEFWSVQPDGNDNRLEYLDSLSRKDNYWFAWSPDGKSIVWLRSFPGDFEEIFIHELETGGERQLTFDRKNISDACWAQNDMIIFSSNKGGNTNLWMVAAAGGPSVQITSGNGPDGGMKISADGRKMVYGQRQFMGNIWLASTDGKSVHKVTFDDGDAWSPALSPDGKRIAFQSGSGLPSLSPSTYISLMDRDGNNRRQLTSSDMLSVAPKWSPDGKWIAFNARPVLAPAESTKVYLVDPISLQKERAVGKGQLRGWADDTTLITMTEMRSWLTSINGGDPKPCFEDSTAASPILSGKYILYRELQSGKRGVWIVSAGHQHDPSRRWAKRITSGNERTWVSQNFGQLFLLTEEREFYKISLPEGKREKLQVTLLSGTRLNIGGCVSYDGKEIVYVDSGLKTKYVMIENLFK